VIFDQKEFYYRKGGCEMGENLKKKWLASLLTILSMLFFIVSCGGGGGGNGGGGQASNSTVSGTVLDSNNDPVSGAMVTITSTPVTTYTDSNGDFFAQVEVGDHTITVTSGNSTVYTGNFSVSDTSPVNLGGLTPTSPFFAMNNADLNGTYFYGSVHLAETQGRTMAMEADCDGIGTITTTIIADSQGETGGESISYSVTADGTFKADNTEPGDEVTGQLSADGEFISCVDTNSLNHHIYMGFAVKRSTGLTNADFNGTFIMSQLGFDPDPFSNLIQITADGAGNFNYQQLPSGDSGSGTYSVADDGAVTITGEADTQGQLSYDGSVFLFVDTSSDYTHISVGFQQSSGMLSSDLSGIYQMVAVNYEDNDINTVITARGNLTADGEGSVVFSFPEISDGTSGTHEGNISTSANGTITTGGGMVGQLSGDGGLFAFPDADSESNLNLFLVGIRKP
jgi:hypothetical protein